MATEDSQGQHLLALINETTKLQAMVQLKSVSITEFYSRFSIAIGVREASSQIHFAFSTNKSMKFKHFCWKSASKNSNLFKKYFNTHFSSNPNVVQTKGCKIDWKKNIFYQFLQLEIFYVSLKILSFPKNSKHLQHKYLSLFFLKKMLKTLTSRLNFDKIFSFNKSAPIV